MKIDRVKIQKEVKGENWFYIVIVSFEGYLYSRIWPNIEPSEKEICRVFRDEFSDDKRLVNYYHG